MALAPLHCCKFHSFPSDIQVTPFQKPDDIHLLLLIFLVDFMNCVAPLQSCWSRPIKSKPQWRQIIKDHFLFILYKIKVS